MTPTKNRVRYLQKTPVKVSSGVNGSGDKKIQDPVEVFCRLRTRTEENQDDLCVTLSSPTTLTFLPPEGLKSRKAVQYSFSHIFTEHADQKEVFLHIAMPLLKGLVQGKDGLLFTYGVTSSGKTYTMTGEPNNPGIIPRCIDALFNTIGSCQIPKFIIKSDKMNGFEIQSDVDALGERLKETRQIRRGIKKNSSNTATLFYKNDGTTIWDINENSLYAVFVSYVEVYNNIAYDLLDGNSNARSLQAKILREDCNHNVYVNGVVEIEVKSANDTLQLFSIGKKRKRMAHTSLNAESSRSHSIFTFRVVAIPADIEFEIVRDGNLFTSAQLSLVDLAGSERCARSQTTGQHLKEAGCINNSLMSLRTCLEILRENQKTGASRIVPYRDSRLTHLFKKYFEGEGKVEMIVCVNPSIKDYDENIHVMKFAEMTREVKILRAEKKKIELDLSPQPQLDDDVSSVDEMPIFVSAAVQTSKFESPERICSPTVRQTPNVRIVDPKSDEINSLICHLKRRRKCQDTYKEIFDLSLKFRNRLVELQNREHDYEYQMKQVIPAYREEIKNLKKQLAELEYRNSKSETQCFEKDEQIENLKMMLEEMKSKLKHSVNEKSKLKRKFEEKITHELDTQLKQQRDVLESTMRSEMDKIELVKDILSDKIPVRDVKNTEEPIKDNYCEIRTEVNILEEQLTSPTHLPRRDAPVANVRYRRSGSAGGDKWLEHRPANPTPLGTVFQPTYKRHKSVVKLTNMKDVVKSSQGKYVLVSQGQDDVGELETKLYKGDIIPTCTGGAQVIFDDVEKLKQESPLKTNTPKSILKRSNMDYKAGNDKKSKRN